VAAPVGQGRSVSPWKPSVAFLANVPEFGKAGYSLVAGGTSAPDDECE